MQQQASGADSQLARISKNLNDLWDYSDSAAEEVDAAAAAATAAAAGEEEKAIMTPA